MTYALSCEVLLQSEQSEGNMSYLPINLPNIYSVASDFPIAGPAGFSELKHSKHQNSTDPNKVMPFLCHAKYLRHSNKADVTNQI